MTENSSLLRRDPTAPDFSLVGDVTLLCFADDEPVTLPCSCCDLRYPIYEQMDHEV